MYWFYLFFFLLAVSAPIFIEGEAWHLTEDMRESTVVLVVGALAFALYILKEKSLLRHVREKLWFQHKNTAITKDLSQSYSYIGEVNRKLDIVKGMMQRLVSIIDAEAPVANQDAMLWEILDTVAQLTQSECVSMRIFTGGVCTHHLEEAKDKKMFGEVADTVLLKSTKSFFGSAGVQVIASQNLRKETKIFLLLSRKHNDQIDEDIVGIILAFLAVLETFLKTEEKTIEKTIEKSL